MNILLNASNLKAGGGLQVADSICSQLARFPQHRFTVVLSSFMDRTAECMAKLDNVEVVRYDVKNNLPTLLLGRDATLDALVADRRIDAALTVFGPSRWNPRCPHLVGFARAQLLFEDGLYYKILPAKQRRKELLQNRILGYLFRRSTRYFWTENAFISQKLERAFKGAKVFTVTNFYNQVYDQPELARAHPLPPFDGTTLLTVSTSYPHKNLRLAHDAAVKLRALHPDFRFRFVMTITAEEFGEISPELADNFLFIGRVDIGECPDLYRQSDIMFQPTLLECFTATYPEAMKMRVPIVTTDLEFAHGLCADAAAYYSPLDAAAAANAIFRVATDTAYRAALIEKGAAQLATFDNYAQRADKLVAILEKIV